MKTTASNNLLRVLPGLLLCAAAFASFGAIAPAEAPAPRRNAARFEVKFMKGMIDHHFMAVMAAELCSTKDVEPELAELCESIIGRGAERISNLAQSLLAFSRPAREEHQPLDVNEVIERALELCHYHVLKGGVRLEKRLDPGLPRVLGTASLLEMALINLVVNAIQALDGEGLLTVSSTSRGEAVEVAVADTGPGIPPEIRDSLFEPFVTTKPEGRGTGLGLSTVLMVVERHNGKIDFSSDGAAGTVFRIALPTA